MADFRKILGLAGVATLFTGMAFGQATSINCTPGAANTNGLSTTGVSFIRAEGQTELLPQLTVSCSNAGAAAAGSITVQVFLSPSVSITNPIVTSNMTTAVAQIGGGTTVNGVVNGSSITFSNITVPAGLPAFTVVISNIRVNATAIPVVSGAAPSPINAQAFVSGTNVTPGQTGAASAVAYVTNGLITSKFYSEVALSNSGKTTFGSNNYGVCGSINSSNSSSATPNLFLSITEGFQSAFRKQVNEQGQAAPELNIAGSGTRVKITFGNVPAGLDIFMPVSLISTTPAPVGTPPTLPSPPAVLMGQISETAVTNGAGTNNQVADTSRGGFTLVASGGALVQSGITVNGLPVSAGGVFKLSVVNGTAVAIYEVTTDNLNVTDQFIAPVYFRADTNAVVSQSAALTVTTSLAPTGGPSIPTFQAISSSSSTLNTVNFNQCASTLLFPFVTNQNGFETGIAIDNTTGDPFGSVKPQAGACKLFFYNGAPGGTNPTAGPAPNPNEGGTAPYNASEAYAFTLSMALASASTSNTSTFSGYMIANCQFTNAHGFGYILYGALGQPNASTMGYLALVLNRGTSGGVESSGQ